MGVSKDFRDYYGGKEAHSFLKPDKPKRPRTRGEKIADVVHRVLLATSFLALDNAPRWVPISAAVGAGVAILVAWCLERRDKRGIREAAT